MSTSGTRVYAPKFADILSNAFEDVGIAPEKVTGEHIASAMRAANFVLNTFAIRGVKLHQLLESTITLVDGTAEYALPEGTIDVLAANVRKDNADTPVWPIATLDYHRIPDKTTEGRPSVYWVDRTANARTITVWPVTDGVDDTLRLWLLMRHETITHLNETLPVPPEWVDALATGIAHRMSRKYARDRTQELMVDAEIAFQMAQVGTRERAPFRTRARGYF